MILRKRLKPEEYAAGIKEGNISVLSRAITLVESRNPEDQKIASALLDLVLPFSGDSIRIGITGVPGVGKSTFIESFGTYLTNKGHHVAVLAVDPTSQHTHGSILGDKTRMDKLSVNPKAYIRPSAAGSTLGGVGSATREAMLLCEAAGYDVVIVETVGVGQSETLVREMVDFFLLLMLAGAGDELQGIKRGIMEMADGLVINKADGENITAAKRAKSEYQTALHYLPPLPNHWSPKVLTCSSIENKGIDEIWQMLRSYFDQMTISGWLKKNRDEQNLHWFNEKVNYLIHEKFFNNDAFKQKMKKAENEVTNGKKSPSSAAHALIHLIGQESS